MNPDVKELIVRVDELNKQINNKLKLVKANKKKQMLLNNTLEFIHVSAIYNSLALGANSLSQAQISWLYSGEDIINVKQKDYLEYANLLRAHKYFLTKDKRTKFDIKLIKLMHQYLYMHINDDTAGTFKKKANAFPNSKFVPSLPNKVESELKQKIYQFNYKQEMTNDSILLEIFKFHAEFEFIRPFDEANGVCGRLIMNWLLKINNYQWIIIDATKKSEYYKQLEAIQKTKKFDNYYIFLLKIYLENLKHMYESIKNI